MNSRPSPCSEIRVGEWDLDLQSGELRKPGAALRLQEQPLQILQMLVERPGKLVSREDLRRRIWPADTFVDFDHGLYSAIKRLRDALGDSTEKPVYIETLSRRGYRLIAPVTTPLDAGEPQTTLAKEAVPSVGVHVPGRFGRLANAILAGTVLLVAVLLRIDAGNFRGRLFGSSAAKPITSLAVLPLENLSADPGQEYFADGMTDELITDLAQLGELRVISRTSVMHYKGTQKTLPQIAHELNVDAAVEGTVTRMGDRVRLRAQLIRVADDRHLWAQAYDREYRDVLVLQSEAARDIANQIRMKLFPGEPARPVNPEAYEAYMRGRYELDAATSEPDFDRSISSFEMAIAKDPQSALGYAGLANSYLALSDYYRPPREVMPKAKEAARKALELDEKLSEAHDALGWLELIYDWNWPKAEQHMKRAIELNSNNALAHDHYASLFSTIGNNPEAFAESKRAQALDPLSLVIHADSGFYVFYMGRQYDQAIEEEHRALELEPNCYTCRAYLALALAQKGQFAEALMEARRVRLPEATPIDVATAASVIAAAGERAEAERLLSELRQVEKKRFVCPYEIATTNLALGARDEAFRWLEEAYEARSICMIWLRVDPRLDPLRSDPRFQDLVRRVGLPQ
jgi:TolB-like protein/DNA-binding winged helix-turn-helix (wHTH) protein/Tfp pilus assembly protein PilF